MPRLGSFVVGVTSLLLLLSAVFPSSPQAARTPKPDAGPIPYAGSCPGTGGSCTMNDGCPGIKACQDGLWVCTYKGTGSIGCTACGQSGTRACTTSGPSGTCSVANLSQGCWMGDGCPGLQACDNGPGGTWNWGSCGYSGSGSRSCTACGQSGSQSCGGSGPYGACNVAVMQQACGSGGCGGSQSCNNTPGGTWNACSCPAQFTCHTAAGDICGTTGVIACTPSCQPSTSTCTIYEQPNNCDDNGNGLIDEGLFQTSCDL